MAQSDTVFAGSIPRPYDRYLGPLIFQPYAPTGRAGRQRPPQSACSRRRPAPASSPARWRALPGAAIVATDLNQPMLDHAAAAQGDAAFAWQQADALALPFPDRAFDAVACQFGAMFFPDKATAYGEARRVLRRGGRSCSTSGTASRRMSSPMSSPWRRRHCSPTIRRVFWRARRTAITTSRESAPSLRPLGSSRVDDRKLPHAAARSRRAIRRSATARARRCATRSRPAIRPVSVRRPMRRRPHWPRVLVPARSTARYKRS